MTALHLSGIALAVCLGYAYGQSVPAPLTFEVASVKPAEPLDPQKIKSGQMRIGRRVDRARVEYSSMTLEMLIGEAYQVRSYQLAGPDWISGVSAPRFDIQAKMPEGATEDQIPQMLQSLLAERFGLKTHKATREHNIYALVVARTGVKVILAENAADDPNQQGVIPNQQGVIKGSVGFGTARVSDIPDTRNVRLELAKVSMERLVNLLSRVVDRPVLDRTGLKGEYQIALELSTPDLWAMGGAAGGGSRPRAGAEGNRMVEAADSGPSIFESVQKLGLKLEARKGPLETIVIDRLEKTPTEN